MAVLCTLACNEPLAWMLTLLRELLKSLQLKTHEVDLTLRCIPRKTTVVHPDGHRQDNWPKYSHSLLRVISTKTKTQWAIDIGGSQYGIFAPVWPWEDYMSSFVERKYLMKVYPLGTNRAVLKEGGKAPGSPSVVFGMIGEMAGAIDEALATFENTNIKLSELLQLSNSNFDTQSNTLLDAINTAVCEYKENNAKSIMTKHNLAQLYEWKYTGLSLKRNKEMTEKLFEQHLESSEHASSIREYVVDGVRHILV